MNALLDQHKENLQIEANIDYVISEAKTGAHPVIRSVDGTCIDGTRLDEVGMFDGHRQYESIDERTALITAGQTTGDIWLGVAAEHEDEDWQGSPAAIEGFAMHAYAKQRSEILSDYFERQAAVEGKYSRAHKVLGALAIPGAIAFGFAIDSDTGEQIGRTAMGLAIAGMLLGMSRIFRKAQNIYEQNRLDLAA